MSRILSGLALSAALSRIALGTDCYFPNSDKTSTHQPCPGVTDDSPGSCCASFDGWPHVDTCLSNGYCFSVASGKLYRGACTVWNWDTDACPHHCTDVTTADDATISSCDNAGGYVCCGNIADSNAADCCTESNIWAWNNGYMLLNSSTIAAVQANASVSASVAPAESTNRSATASACPKPTSSGVSQGAAIGIGVGLGVPLLVALATLAYLFFAWKPKTKRNLIKAEPHERQDLVPAPNSGGWVEPYEVGATRDKPHERHEVPNDPIRFEAP